MSRDCQVVRIHRAHINEVKRWAMEYQSMRRLSDRGPTSRIIEQVVGQARTMGGDVDKILCVMPDGLPKEAMVHVAQRAQIICRREGLDVCARYDSLSNKVVLVDRLKVKDICWFSRGRAPAAA